MQNSINKVKDELNSYLQNNQMSPLFEFVERTVHIDRSIIALGMFLSFFFFISRMILFLQAYLVYLALI